MSFDLLSFKKEKNEKLEEKYFPHIVVGSDIYALATYRELLKQYGADQVLLFMSEKVTPEDLMFLGPTTLRGEANTKLLQAEFPELDPVAQRQAVFFKELKWRKFGGRSKPEPLLHDEEYFTQEGVELDAGRLTGFFFPQGIEAVEQFNQQAHIALISELRKEHPQDMIDPVHWSLKSSDGVIFKAKNLYWSGSPNSFVCLLKNKEEISDKYIQFCESTYAPALLKIRLEFEEKVTEKRETLFIPLSYTHEWGHFIGEFYPVNEEKQGEQTADFFTFVDTDQSNEERISKIIRILKRNLEKIFPQTKKISYREFISLQAEGPCHKIDDKLYADIANEAPGLVFVGVNAPLSRIAKQEQSCEDSHRVPSYIARGMLSFARLQNSLHS